MQATNKANRHKQKLRAIIASQSTRPATPHPTLCLNPLGISGATRSLQHARCNTLDLEVARLRCWRCEHSTFQCRPTAQHLLDFPLYIRCHHLRSKTSVRYEPSWRAMAVDCPKPVLVGVSAAYGCPPIDMNMNINRKQYPAYSISMGNNTYSRSIPLPVCRYQVRGCQVALQKQHRQHRQLVVCSIVS
jgi:hypothetical protein